MSAENPVDRETVEHLRELMGHEFGSLVESFLDDATTLLAGLADAVSANDPQRVHEQAHAMKSASANMGAMRLSELCRQLEALGKSGTIGNGAEIVSDAQNEFVKVREFFVAEPA